MLVVGSDGRHADKQFRNSRLVTQPLVQAQTLFEQSLGLLVGALLFGDSAEVTECNRHPAQLLQLPHELQTLFIQWRRALVVSRLLHDEAQAVERQCEPMPVPELSVEADTLLEELLRLLEPPLSSRHSPKVEE